MSADLQYVLTWVKDLFTSLWGQVVLLTIAVSLVGLFITRK